MKKKENLLEKLRVEASKHNQTKSQQKHLFQPAINKKKVGMKMRFTFFKHLQLHYLTPTYCRYLYKYSA